MNDIQILDREMTPAEPQRVHAGFAENTVAHGVDVQTAERFSFTALSGGKMVGCVSGLAYKNGDRYSGWCYLTDLFVEAPYRSRGLGGELLQKLEKRLAAAGVQNIWTWTAGYEAPAFYRKQGYAVFAEMEHWYSDGSGRVGLRKRLSA